MSQPASRPLAVRPWRWAPVVAWMVLIFLLSAQPGLRISADANVDGPTRHLAHVAMYAVLSVLLMRAMDRLTWPMVGVLTIAIATLYGVTDELHQATVPERNGNAFDVFLDGTGALLGVVTVRWIPRLNRLLRSRFAPTRG